MYLPEMTEIAQDLARILEPACDRIAIAGSIRRRKHEPNDIELVAIPKFVPEGNTLFWLLDTLRDEVVITIGQKCWGQKQRKFIYRGVKVDFFIADRFNWGYKYWMRTGPGDANKFVMGKLAGKNAPWKANAGDIWVADEKAYVPEEQAMFEIMGIPYIPPSKRSIDTYSRLFSDHEHHFTHPELVKDLPVAPEPDSVQLQFDFPNALTADTDEIAHLKAPKKKKPEPRWDWQKPFITADNNIFIYGGYGDWHIYPRSHERAIKMLKFYRSRPLFRESDSKRLMQYIDECQHQAKQLHWSPTGYDVQLDTYLEGDIHGSLLLEWNSKPSYEMIKVSDIVPTQETVLIEHLETWAAQVARGCFFSPDGEKNPPIAMKFSDSGSYYLTDGHHRWYIAKLLGIDAIPCYVDTVDKPLNDCIDWWDEDFFGDVDNETLLATLLHDLHMALEDERV